MAAAAALDVAATTEPAPPSIASGADPSGLPSGSTVIVTPDDTGRDPVRGILLAGDARELVIRVDHARVGRVNVHFPRAGFDVAPA